MLCYSVRAVRPAANGIVVQSVFSSMDQSSRVSSVGAGGAEATESGEGASLIGYISRPDGDTGRSAREKKERVRVKNTAPPYANSSSPSKFGLLASCNDNPALSWPSRDLTRRDGQTYL